MIVPYILLLSLLMLALSSSDAAARIYKRVNPDGSIDFFNKNERSGGGGHRLNRNISSKFDGIIETLSQKHGVDPKLIKCIIRVESDFDPEAVSPAGAMGLMQLMKETADYYNLANPFDPEKNIDAGIRHFKSLQNYFRNDIPLALGAYHAGIGRVKKRMSLPPIQATIDYVNAIMSLYTGETGNYSEHAVRRLYKRIERDGTIVLYSR
ncbi:MAG TPA: lytic transglycosylase domain-containing protein [Spirochaetota bacterium]|nr:lytic transglycosylase domain-containing protein [Spirochaetota bacterium]HPC42101.1 lytic transglycosylase domain-containing protein [Spirochaetota bacterium]HPL16766.1 lytic transglycosylase domain-containing protein [Spirochaetota bacterium]HQF09055.1 lytic transglycosylase domain-containing protein [Spirochaetota bacterium]HQH97943.1 lytic transglycosylase domain-containing protein [Spirochaetota bacterium]